ncbi:MAG: dephospho-CoA kinase [Verrucomicrobiota bacterium]
MKVFGLTGGIGMGKSTAASHLAEQGVPVVDTDILARQVVEPGRPALKEIQLAFGSQMIAPDGSLNREALAQLVFADRAARQQLESITHPRIQLLWQEQILRWRMENQPRAVVVIPLLFETAAEKELDRTICVACTAGTQQARLRQRGWSAEQIAGRIAAQWPVEKKMARADFVVWSEGEPAVLGRQLNRIVLGQ